MNVSAAPVSRLIRSIERSTSASAAGSQRKSNRRAPRPSRRATCSRQSAVFWPAAARSSASPDTSRWTAASCASVATGLDATRTSSRYSGGPGLSTPARRRPASSSWLRREELRIARQRHRVRGTTRRRVPEAAGSGDSLKVAVDDRREAAERAADQPPEVVAGDVLDDRAAGLDEPSVGERQRDADQQVARRAVPMAQRAGVVGRDDAADRRRVERAVERQPLPVLRQLVGSRRASVAPASTVAVRSPCDAPRAGCSFAVDSDQVDRCGGRPHRQLRAAAADHRGPGARRRRAAASRCRQLAATSARRRRIGAPAGSPSTVIRIVRPARRARPDAARYGPGTSPHSRGVGSTLPGLQRRCGSNASRTACITSRSSSREHPRHVVRLSAPTPCSPVIDPPASTQYVRISPATSSASVRLARHPLVVADQRVQVAVAGVKHVADAQARPRSTSARIRPSTSGSLVRGTTPSCT